MWRGEVVRMRLLLLLAVVLRMAIRVVAVGCGTDVVAWNALMVVELETSAVAATAAS